MAAIQSVIGADQLLQIQRDRLQCLSECYAGEPEDCTCFEVLGEPPAPPAPPAQGGVTIGISPEYLGSLGSSDALSDCFLSAEEILSDPEAQAFANAFILATAAQLGVDPSQVTVNAITTDGDPTPGCQTAGPDQTAGMTIYVDPAYQAELGTDEAFADCWLTPDEISVDPEAMLFANSFIEATAAQLGVPPEAITINGMSTDGDSIPGCATSSGSTGGMTINVDPSYQAQLGTDATFADCWLTPEEIASDPEAAAFAAGFIATTAASLGVPESAITLTGISTDGDAEPGCANSGIGGGIGVTIDGDYAATLGNSGAFADCWLSPEEIASDPEAADFAVNFIATTATQVRKMPSWPRSWSQLQPF